MLLSLMLMSTIMQFIHHFSGQRERERNYLNKIDSHIILILKKYDIIHITDTYWNNVKR